MKAYTSIQMFSLLTDYNYAENVDNGAKIYKINGGYYWEGDLNSLVLMDPDFMAKTWYIMPLDCSFDYVYDKYLNGKTVELQGFKFNKSESLLLQIIKENLDKDTWRVID